jgi:hypothetical protein
MRTPLPTSKSTMRRLASLATGAEQSGQRKQYEPLSSSEQTRTVKSAARSWTSPQLGQLALIVVTVLRSVRSFPHRPLR